VSLSNLRSFAKQKYLIVGDTGTGKTRTAVELAVEFARNGKTVRYIDTEQGATNEFISILEELYGSVEKGIEELGGRIDYRVAIKPNELIEALKDATKYDLLVLDSYYPLVQDNVRLYVRDLYLAQGYYKIGEKKIPIENPETFTLSGFMYQLANEFEKKIFEKLLESRTNIVFTTKPIPEEKSDKRNWLYGFFDVVLHLYKTNSGEHLAKVVKVRGKRLNEALAGKLVRDYAGILKKLLVKAGQLNRKDRGEDNESGSGL